MLDAQGRSEPVVWTLCWANKRRIAESCILDVGPEWVRVQK